MKSPVDHVFAVAVVLVGCVARTLSQMSTSWPTSVESVPLSVPNTTSSSSGLVDAVAMNPLSDTLPP